MVQPRLLAVTRSCTRWTHPSRLQSPFVPGSRSRSQRSRAGETRRTAAFVNPCCVSRFTVNSHLYSHVPIEVKCRWDQEFKHSTVRFRCCDLPRHGVPEVFHNGYASRVGCDLTSWCRSCSWPPRARCLLARKGTRSPRWRCRQRHLRPYLARRSCSTCERIRVRKLIKPSWKYRKSL